jgi:hypothetical protein
MSQYSIVRIRWLSFVLPSSQYAERQGLLLLNHAIYIGWTSHCDFRPYTGWLIGYDESTLKQTSVLNLTPNGNKGAIWQSGAGMAVAGDNIFLLDANGTFDTGLNSKGFPKNGNYGNAFVKVSTSTKLRVADYFSMYNTVSESDPPPCCTCFHQLHPAFHPLF